MCPQLTKQYSTFKFFYRSLIFVCLLSAELVPLLLESGASLEARNKDKATPLDSSHNKQVIFDSAYIHGLFLIPRKEWCWRSDMAASYHLVA